MPHQVTEKKEQLAKLESMDCGKPLDEAKWDMDDVAGGSGAMAWAAGGAG